MSVNEVACVQWALTDIQSLRDLIARQSNHYDKDERNMCVRDVLAEVVKRQFVPEELTDDLTVFLIERLDDKDAGVSGVAADLLGWCVNLLCESALLRVYNSVVVKALDLFLCAPNLAHDQDDMERRPVVRTILGHASVQLLSHLHGMDALKASEHLLGSFYKCLNVDIAQVDGGDYTTGDLREAWASIQNISLQLLRGTFLSFPSLITTQSSVVAPLCVKAMTGVYKSLYHSAAELLAQVYTRQKLETSLSSLASVLNETKQDNNTRLHFAVAVTAVCPEARAAKLSSILMKVAHDRLLLLMPEPIFNKNWNGRSGAESVIDADLLAKAQSNLGEVTKDIGQVFSQICVLLCFISNSISKHPFTMHNDGVQVQLWKDTLKLALSCTLLDPLFSYDDNSMGDQDDMDSDLEGFFDDEESLQEYLRSQGGGRSGVTTTRLVPGASIDSASSVRSLGLIFAMQLAQHVSSSFAGVMQTQTSSSPAKFQTVLSPGVEIANSPFFAASAEILPLVIAVSAFATRDHDAQVMVEAVRAYTAAVCAAMNILITVNTYTLSTHGSLISLLTAPSVQSDISFLPNQTFLFGNTSYSHEDLANLLYLCSIHILHNIAAVTAQDDLTGAKLMEEQYPLFLFRGSSNANQVLYQNICPDGLQYLLEQNIHVNTLNSFVLLLLNKHKTVPLSGALKLLVDSHMNTIITLQQEKRENSFRLAHIAKQYVLLFPHSPISQACTDMVASTVEVLELEMAASDAAMSIVKKPVIKGLMARKKEVITNDSDLQASSKSDDKYNHKALIASLKSICGTDVGMVDTDVCVATDIPEFTNENADQLLSVLDDCMDVSVMKTLLASMSTCLERTAKTVLEKHIDTAVTAVLRLAIDSDLPSLDAEQVSAVKNALNSTNNVGIVLSVLSLYDTENSVLQPEQARRLALFCGQQSLSHQLQAILSMISTSKAPKKVNEVVKTLCPGRSYQSPHNKAPGVVLLFNLLSVYVFALHHAVAQHHEVTLTPLQNPSAVFALVKTLRGSDSNPLLQQFLYIVPYLCLFASLATQQALPVDLDLGEQQEEAMILIRNAALINTHIHTSGSTVLFAPALNADVAFPLLFEASPQAQAGTVLHAVQRNTLSTLPLCVFFKGMQGIVDLMRTYDLCEFLSRLFVLEQGEFCEKLAQSSDDDLDQLKCNTEACVGFLSAVTAHQCSRAHAQCLATATFGGTVISAKDCAQLSFLRSRSLQLDALVLFLAPHLHTVVAFITHQTAPNPKHIKETMNSGRKTVYDPLQSTRAACVTALQAAISSCGAVVDYSIVIPALAAALYDYKPSLISTVCRVSTKAFSTFKQLATLNIPLQHALCTLSKHVTDNVMKVLVEFYAIIREDRNKRDQNMQHQTSKEIIGIRQLVQDTLNALYVTSLSENDDSAPAAQCIINTVLTSTFIADLWTNVLQTE